jgi:hypothetical protein
MQYRVGVSIPSAAGGVDAARQVLTFATVLEDKDALQNQNER